MQEKIENIYFDFDGVLCDSVHIKTEAFYEMYLPYGKEIANQVKKYHIQNGGMPRDKKFFFFHSQLLKKDIDKDKIEELSKKFSHIVINKIIKAPLIKGAESFLKNNSLHYSCFIVSATPQKELEFIVKEKNISHYFKKICGSPTTKGQWIEILTKKYSLDNKKSVFIGDAMSDLKAALEHNVRFIARETKENINLFDKKIQSIKNLENLDNILGQV